jgi:hypothetical protein
MIISASSAAFSMMSKSSKEPLIALTLGYLEANSLDGDLRSAVTSSLGYVFRTLPSTLPPM